MATTPWRWTELIFATRNRHKVKELDAMFREALGIRVKGLEGMENLPHIVEDRETFEGNAVKKAETIAGVLGRPVAADDSGLAVDALQGAPGVYSARYAGPDATDAENNRKLLMELEGLPEAERKAAFVCALALAVPGDETRVVRGECPGRIALRPRGENGFGYDPLFFLPERGCTMAELPPEVKNQISHRARATERLIRLLKETFDFGRFKGRKRKE
ncbi:XTP/dITP diphosphohydrolase [Melghirimyces profundicolus]|uniref:dITP/XTP pyrophosphatase n=1 Tax=Melghirimyces profundicolus TaxID=1242148 RepID=A0A2T6BTE8_9BACL|nr:XTP/dITP diphosphatase [Melghirimyces profundicolus]PTX59352.1 XTP/dITP diphosphohydrolase [Melghirimyces profundicolus]